MSTQIRDAQTATTWQIDPAHTHIEFAVRHMMIATVKGAFREFAGTIVLDEEDLRHSAVDVTIDVASIATRSEQRDEHLRSADFFDAETYPAITFTSRRIDAIDGDRFEITGDLTIRDQTREVVLTTERVGRSRSPWGQDVIAFRATTTIDREDYGLTWNQALETGGVLVGKEVRITLEVEAIAQEN